MVYCTVCMNNNRSNKNISFFNYPKDSTKREEWLKAVGREDLLSKLVNDKIRQQYRICEDHFEKSCIKLSKNRTVTYLFSNAFPTLNLPKNGGACSSLGQCENVSIPANEISSSSNKPFNRIVIMPDHTCHNVKTEPDISIFENMEDPALERVCRMCLDIDVKMYDLNRYKLREIFNEVTGISMNRVITDKLPQKLCWECTQRLVSAHRARQKALRAHYLLLDVLNTNQFITIRHVKSINRCNYQLDSTLSTCSNFSNSNIEIDKIKPKIEIVDQEVEHDFDIHYDDVFANDDMDIKEEEVEPKTTGFIFDECSFLSEEDESEECKEEEVKNEVKSNVRVKKQVKVKKSERGVKKKVKVKKSEGRVKKKVNGSQEKIEDIAKAKALVEKLKTRDIQRDRQGVNIDKDLFTVKPLTSEEQIEGIDKRRESTSYLDAAYKCDLCFKGFPLKAQYDSHAVRHSASGGTVIRHGRREIRRRTDSDTSSPRHGGVTPTY